MAMMNLAEYRRTATRLADFLPWAALVGEGVVLNKDGSFQRTARFRGPDLDSAVAAELVAVASRLNNAFRRLGSGWAIFVEAQRHEAASYPASRFADAASALVDAERKADFEEADAHYESSYFLTFLYLPPAEDAARAETWLYEGRQQSGVDPNEALAAFIDRTNRVLQLVDGFMPECRWLDDAETLTYLHSTVSTKRHRVRVPETPIYLDALLADEPLTGGLEPRLGAAHLRVLTINGFPTATTPGILDDLNRLAFPYRWSTRAILGDRLDGRPTLLIVDEGWLALDDEGFAAQLREWLKTLRKKNASVVFATQSLRDQPAATGQLRRRCAAASPCAGCRHGGATKAASHTARLDTGARWRCRRDAGGPRGECQRRRARRTTPRGVLQLDPDLSLERGRALSGLCRSRADNQHRAGTRREPDRRRPDRCGRHSALDHRRHRERLGDHSPRPCSREADTARYHDQSGHHHRPSHLHDRAALGRTPLYAGRRLGLSAAARLAETGSARYASAPGRCGTELSLRPHGRHAAVAANLGLRRRAPRLCRVPAWDRSGRDAAALRHRRRWR
ncbi:conjugal transfer ATPase TrbE [Hyphomonas polymorpha PS728]|uniref:Conjugal transfer ATPase TrbE n=1 Tax=Hyphomonas polymorpha PS728 TaxID=1280954 RepID=A0A062VE17_9PROT|nr:conjugal transfer ATPase TrbE [Hyphomonas polymorpha PS728]